ncbi:MAG TPA: class I SAM-dependent methyltransferase [Cyclobacteriaceae bacterium]|jgi:malonyl-CoA O-methyltransferase|nr:class I SAM-dependent methyltransferase [Cyclobacteriaceae bacterium]
MFSRKIKQLNPLEGYDLWAQTYATEDNPIKRYSDELITNWLGDVRGKSVLDVGCGTGRFCSFAQENGAAKIVGTDLSPQMIKKAKENCGDAELRVADLSKERIEGQFEVVICALVLGHIWELDFVLGNLVNNLAPDGLLLITDFHMAQTLKGAKRTFEDKKSKQVVEIKHHLHSFETYYRILSQANAVVDEVVERKWQGEPVVFGMKIRKRSE